MALGTAFLCLVCSLPRLLGSCGHTFLLSLSVWGTDSHLPAHSLVLPQDTWNHSFLFFVIQSQTRKTGGPGHSSAVLGISGQSPSCFLFQMTHREHHPSQEAAPASLPLVGWLTAYVAHSFGVSELSLSFRPVGSKCLAQNGGFLSTYLGKSSLGVHTRLGEELFIPRKGIVI